MSASSRWDAVANYPDAAFSRDDAAQSTLRANAQGRERRLLTAFIVMAVAFGLLLVSAIARGAVFAVVFGLIFVFAFLFAAMGLLRFVPRTNCSSCGTRMMRRWADGALFLICTNCRRYVYTYLSNRAR